MAKKGIESDNNEVTSLDFITMLSMPEFCDSYDQELVVPENDIDLLKLGAEALKDAEIKEKKQSGGIVNTTPTAVSASAQAPTPTVTRRVAPPPVRTILPTTISSISSSTSSSRNVANQAIKKSLSVLKPLEGFENDSIEQIVDDISKCQKCGLCSTRTKVVPGIGNTKAKLVLIGEAPGADEDASGIPFVGKAGKHLDKILAAAGFKKEEIYICNILKCRPPNNRDPNLEEMRVCTPFLQRQLALIKPKLIGCLGNIAAHYVIGPTIPGITKIRGQWFESIFGIPTFAMYHPSYLIRSESREKGSPNWQMWQDIRVLKAKYDSIK